jgi:hypothetical protein
VQGEYPADSEWVDKTTNDDVYSKAHETKGRAVAVEAISPVVEVLKFATNLVEHGAEVVQATRCFCESC